MKMTKRQKYFMYWLLVLIAFPVFAEYQIKRFSINSSSSSLEQPSIQSSRFELKGNAGQSDASEHLTADNYRLNGGFWHENTDLIFKDNLE